MCKTYYVNPLTGKDENDGLHEDRAFATLFAVNRLALAPGDTVLLRRGCRIEKQFLQLQCSGTEGSPITIGAYGEGCAPCIAADGQGIWYQDYGCALDSPTHVHHGYVSSAVLLYDAAYVTVRDLEITNRAEAVIGERYSQADKMQRTGVAVVARDKGIRRGITLQNLQVHDVNGNVYDKHMNNGGIYMTALRPENEAATGAARFGDILVEGCYVAHVSRWGIAVGYTYAHAQFQGAALDELTDRCDIGMGGLGIHRLGQTVSRPLKQREYMARGLPFFYAVNDPDMPADESMCRRLPDDETIPDGAEILRFAKESRLDAELPARMRAYAREHLGWEQQFKPVLERLEIPWNETSSI